MEDLAAGLTDHFTPLEAWDNWYSKNETVVVVERVTKAQFLANFPENKKQMTAKKKKSMADYESMRHHLHINPQKKHNAKGELIFSAHPAQKLLRQDIKNSVHEGKTPHALRLTRPEYQQFSIQVFRQRIYQEIRRAKFVNHMNQERLKKDAKRSKRFATNMSARQRNQDRIKEAVDEALDDMEEMEM